MKLTRESLKRKLLLWELALLELFAIWLFATTRAWPVFLFLSLTVAILWPTLFWIDWLIRHDVDNFVVCMVFGVFVFAADFWFYGHRIVGAAIGIVGVIALVAFLRKLFRPLDSEQQAANLEKYRAQKRAQGKFNNSLTSELGGLLVLVIVLWPSWTRTGYPKGTDLWFLIGLLTLEIAKIIFLRFFPSDLNEAKAITAGSNN